MNAGAEMLKKGWTFALVVGSGACMLSDRWAEAVLFLVMGGLFTWAYYADQATARLFERVRIDYERKYGPDPSRKRRADVHLALAEWLRTENGKSWSRLPQAREFLASPHARSILIEDAGA